MTRRMQRALLAAAVSVLLFATLPGFADSLVRIVRLSDVEGKVQVDRHTGQGFERAILNMPITQGMMVRTGDNGRAEIEFEEGTVVRLVPDTQIDFQQLSLRSSGARLSTIQLDQGTAYFNVRHKGDDEFTILLGQRRIPITRSAHFRIKSSGDDAKLAVYNGDVWVKQDGDQVKVKKGEELALNLADNSNTLAKSIEPAEDDQWDRQRLDYHESYYTASGYGGYPYYGRGDLSYYGGWYDVPGYGNLWQPYNVGLGWDPFSAGYWGWYPGFGYMWVSSYPWGWLPYRYGSWVWVPSWGWGWMPGAYWGPFRPWPTVVNAPSGFVAPDPPKAPNLPTTVANNPPPRPVAPNPDRPRNPRLISPSSGDRDVDSRDIPVRPARPPVVGIRPGMPAGDIMPRVPRATPGTAPSAPRVDRSPTVVQPGPRPTAPAAPRTAPADRPSPRMSPASPSSFGPGGSMGHASGGRMAGEPMGRMSSGGERSGGAAARSGSGRSH